MDTDEHEEDTIIVPMFGHEVRLLAFDVAWRCYELGRFDEGRRVIRAFVFSSVYSGFYRVGLRRCYLSSD